MFHNYWAPSSPIRSFMLYELPEFFFKKHLYFFIILKKNYTFRGWGGIFLLGPKRVVRILSHLNSNTEPMNKNMPEKSGRVGLVTFKIIEDTQHDKTTY